MAFFKFRKDGDEPTTVSPAPESVDAMRKRARHRLIGAAVLVAAGVIGFPLLFDKQPRPISVDLPINIPDKNTVKPLGNLPVGNAAASKVIDETAAPEIAAPVLPAPAASRTATGTLGNAPAVGPARPATKPVDGASSALAARPLPVKPEPSKLETSKPDPSKADGTKAQSLLEGKTSSVPSSVPASAPVGVGRYVVQVGAFSDVVKAREARLKLESAGLKTYTQVVTPKEGKRIRVRLGPFENKAEADKAAAKVKTLDLPAAVLEL